MTILPVATCGGMLLVTLSVKVEVVQTVLVLVTEGPIRHPLWAAIITVNLECRFS